MFDYKFVNKIHKETVDLVFLKYVFRTFLKKICNLINRNFVSILEFLTGALKYKIMLNVVILSRSRLEELNW